MQHSQKNIFIITAITLSIATLLASFFLFVLEVSLFDYWELYLIPFISSIAFVSVTKKQISGIKTWETIIYLLGLSFAYVLLLHIAERIYYADAVIRIPGGGEISRYTLNALFTFSTPPGGLFIIGTWILFLLPGVIFTLSKCILYIFRSTKKHA